MDKDTNKDVSHREIAKLALAMHDRSYFFQLRRGLRMNFSRDLNGSGVQGLFIHRESDAWNAEGLIEVYFDYTSDKNTQFLYEAELITDQRKDYEPSINRGMHRFISKRAKLRIEWDGDEIQQWRSDIERLNMSPKTLNDWIDNELEMSVRCSHPYFCREPAIFTKSDLQRYAEKGYTLDDLRTKFKCSKCGKRGARIQVF